MQMIAKTVARLANFDRPLGISALAASRPRRRVLCGLALLLIVMCFVTPPFQSPDEHRHFFRAYQLSEGVLLPYPLQTNMQEGTTVQALHTSVGGTLPRAIDVLLLATHADRLRFNPNERLRAADLVSALAIKVDVNDRVFFRFPHEIPFPPYAFAPQAAGILLARAFTDRILIQFYASRLVNAMFALTLVWLALLMVPSLWPICLAFCSLPLVSFQMGSSSPDAMRPWGKHSLRSELACQGRYMDALDARRIAELVDNQAILRTGGALGAARFRKQIYVAIGLGRG